MTARLDISLFAALCLLLAVTFTSCSQIYEEGACAQEPKGSRISLKFKIRTESASTTRGLGQWTEPSANLAERILNPQDVRVLLLNTAAEPQLVKTFKPNVLEYVKGKDEGGTITGDGYYELSVFFEDENIDRMEDTDTVTFNVMIFANINSLGGGYTTDAMGYGTARSRLQELFTMPAEWFPSDSKGIPMYGYKSGITVTKEQLADEHYVMGDITMLRAMSKIEVYDNIVGATVASDGKKYPFVEKVELISWRDKGYLRPLYDGYEVSGLKEAYIPTTSTVVTDRAVNAHYVNDGFGVEGNMENKNCFRLYCPEAKLADIRLRVSATLAPNEHKQYVVELGQYANKVFDGVPYGTDLVRNHIYRFSVNSLSPMADLTLTVQDWGLVDAEYTLDDIVSMSENGFLQWTNVNANSNLSLSTVTYNGKDEQQLSFLRGTNDFATGTFHIASPKGAVWRAYFIPGENGVDAFEFVDVDAAGNVTNPRSYAEGKVGEEATINIRGKGDADAYRHTAELVVEVRQVDGTVLYAPLTASGSSRYIIYRENKL